MKHTWKITAILLGLFFLAQLVGLLTINKYIQVERTEEGIIIKHADTLIGPQPEIEDKSLSAIPIIIAVLIGTGLVLLLIRFKLGRLWKLWFFAAIFITLAISFDIYMARSIAVILALALAAIKIFKPNAIVHNLTEVFVYTGITIILLPLLNIVSAISLLILISLYDMYAVWKSKHMVKMAKFQTESKVFAGLMLHYSLPKKANEAKSKKVKSIRKSAILGGGDIAFPLLFSAAVMEHLIIDAGLPQASALLQAMVITVLATAMLGLLLLKSQKEKFYPAMPFISIGCFVGYGILWLLNFL